jgi:hypothetical protein
LFTGRGSGGPIDPGYPIEINVLSPLEQEFSSLRSPASPQGVTGLLHPQSNGFARTHLFEIILRETRMNNRPGVEEIRRHKQPYAAQKKVSLPATFFEREDRGGWRVAFG